MHERAIVFIERPECCTKTTKSKCRTRGPFVNMIVIVEIDIQQGAENLCRAVNRSRIQFFGGRNCFVVRGNAWEHEECPKFDWAMIVRVKAVTLLIDVVQVFSQTRYLSNLGDNLFDDILGRSSREDIFVY